MLKKMLLVLDGQTGVLDRGIHKKNQIISNINLLIDKFDTIQQPILFTRHTNKTSLVAETGSWELVSTIRCPETPIYFNKKRSNIFAELKFQVQVSHLLKFIGYLVFVGYLAAKDSSDSSFNKHSRGVA